MYLFRLGGFLLGGSTQLLGALKTKTWWPHRAHNGTGVLAVVNLRRQDPTTTNNWPFPAPTMAPPEVKCLFFNNKKTSNNFD
jgi:hypothetical protein